jgi:hypothetical protein
MTKEISVRLPERVWNEVIDYEPFPPGVGLAPAIRAQLQAAVALTEERPALLSFRIATFSLDAAHQLQAWLTAVSRRGDAPVGAGVALVAVGEGIRLAA